MPRYFKNVESLDAQKKKELEQVWIDVRGKKGEAKGEVKEDKKDSKEKKEAKTPKQPSTKSPEEPKKSKLKLKIALAVTFVALVILAGFLVSWYFLFSKSLLTVVVKDKKSSEVLVDVLVSLDGSQSRTDDFGKARFDNLSPGEQTLKISYSGYKEYSKLINIKRGNNGEMDVLIDLARIKVGGVILDYIDKKPVAGAEVKIGEITGQTDESGVFELSEVLPGKQKLKISQDGYYDYEVEFTSTQEEENLGDLKITPKSRAVFGSNRDGDQAVYVSRLDGKEAKKLWENVPGFDDLSPSLSPDGKKVAFNSSRDNERDNYGDLKSKLYVYSLEDSSAKRISDDKNIYQTLWSYDGSSLVYLEGQYEKDVGTRHYLNGYDFDQEKIISLADNTDFQPEGESTPSASISRVITSPAENLVAFTVYNYNYPDKKGIYTVKTNGTGLQKISEKTPSAEFQFSSDGKSITYEAYLSDSIKRYSIDLSSGRESLIPFDETKRGYYTQGYYETRELKTSDGSKTVFVDFRDGKNDLYLSSGETERRLTYMGGVDKIAFAGGEKYIVFSVSLQNETALYVIGLEEGNDSIKISDIYGSSFAGVLEE